jgi:hypothetical protein
MQKTIFMLFNDIDNNKDLKERNDVIRKKRHTLMDTT